MPPRDEAEEEIYAVEAFRVDTQHLLQRLINQKRISKERLEEKAGVKLDEVFSDEYELTVRQLARLAFHLGSECSVAAIPRNAQKCDYLHLLHSEVE